MHSRTYFAMGLIATAISTGLITNAWAAEYRSSDIQEYIQQLYSNSDEDRASAGERLSEVGPEAKAAVPRLIELVQRDPKMSVRGEAAKALGSIGPAAADAAPALISFVKNKDAGIERAYAATALGSIAAQAEVAVPTLAEIVQNDDQESVRQLCARALGDFGAKATSAVPVLINAIKTGKKELREAACDALSHIPAAPSDLNSLTEMLSDEISISKAAAAKALAGLGQQAAPAIPELIKLIKDSDERVRLAAIQTLGTMGKNAKPALLPLKDATKDPFMKTQAEKAIADIKAAR